MNCELIRIICIFSEEVDRKTYAYTKVHCELKQSSVRIYMSKRSSVSDGKMPLRGGAGGGASPLVDCDNSNSSWVISEGISLKRSVDMYLSPVSGIMARMFVPGGQVSANASAADKMPPPLMPEKIPSFCAKSRVVSMAELPRT